MKGYYGSVASMLALFILFVDYKAILFNVILDLFVFVIFFLASTEK